MSNSVDATEQAFWNRWNASTRECYLDRVSFDQADFATKWIGADRGTDLDIIEVGCGAGWMTPILAPFGRVTATDLADEVLDRAAERWPDVRFVAGDFMALDLGEHCYDVVVTFEVLSHVADQSAFVSKLHRLLRPDGLLILATQNRPALERNKVPAPQPGQRRHWVDRFELTSLLESTFDLAEMRSVTPKFNQGVLRVVNSHKVDHTLKTVGLSRLTRLAKELQERSWLGWTIVVAARTRPSQQPEARSRAQI